MPFFMIPRVVFKQRNFQKIIGNVNRKTTPIIAKMISNWRSHFHLQITPSSKVFLLHLIYMDFSFLKEITLTFCYFLKKTAVSKKRRLLLIYQQSNVVISSYVSRRATNFACPSSTNHRWSRISVVIIAIE